ncbi:MAG: hypothetical protein WBS24_03470 [Terriglobales bacterium]
MNVDEFEHLVVRSLELGVPTHIVAELYELPLATAKEIQKQVRVRDFTTDDQAEFVENLQWRALQEADRMLRSGSPDQAMKIVTSTFGRQIQAAGNRPSDKVTERRNELMETLRSMRESPAVPAAPGRFVLGNAGTDRRANQSEDETED